MRSPWPSARRNSNFAFGIVLPAAQVCARIGDVRSASLMKVMSDNSARSAVWPPPVEDVAERGCEIAQLTDSHSIQPWCF